MGTVRNVSVAILLISFFTFVAFFGRLPALRNTPIGALHRIIWIHIPSGVRGIDQRLTQGRLSSWAAKQAHILWNDRHPIVMVFFIALLAGAEVLFLPPAWALLTRSRKVISIILLLLPYVFLYASAATDPGYIDTENISQAMSLYPYDFTVFFPGHNCRTCHTLKPARSKHCSICKRCISKYDHHCIFINNCVGYKNQHCFLLLLFFTGVLTIWASYVGLTILSSLIQEEIPSWTVWGTTFTWRQCANIWGWVLQEHTRMGAVTLLCILTSPLVWGLLGYHIYLIYCGTTTNESMKWADWAAEMGDGFVFKRKLPADRRKHDTIEPLRTHWPVESEQIILRTEDGLPPVGPLAIGVGNWERVWRLADVENLYDLGFWDNLMDVFWTRYGLHGLDAHENRRRSFTETDSLTDTNVIEIQRDEAGTQ